MDEKKTKNRLNATTFAPMKLPICLERNEIYNEYKAMHRINKWDTRNAL